MKYSRRDFLLTGAALGVVPLLRIREPAASTDSRRLRAGPASHALVGSGAPDTDVWAYEGSVPGPVLRLKRGQRLAVDFRNDLPQPTTVHWHGLRVPNAMDGVPFLTQAPVAPGEGFHYAFEARDSGTFWYHPHFRSSEQQDRGLHGVVVVEDDEPPQVDRDLVWVLDDWRLDERARIVEDFGDLHDASHQGRFGNTATVNGRVPPDFAVRAGERIRLRLVNVANAWIFGLDFTGHSPRIIAYDGHGVTPHAPPDGRVVVGPSQRVDVILDMTGAPGERFEVVDRFYRQRSYKLLDVVYGKERMRDAPPPGRIALPPPALTAPDLDRAERHQVTFAGGAMGGMRSARFKGEDVGIRELARAGKVWAVNGVVASRHDQPSVLTLARGRTHVIEFRNETAFPHPVHLHGQPMQVLTVKGKAPPHAVWRDTVLMGPRSEAEVAVVADNPGRWMLHCHIPEHQEAGMMAVVDVV